MWAAAKRRCPARQPDNEARRRRRAFFIHAKGNETMTIYLLTYDLLKEPDSEDYKPLWAELKRLGGHKVQYSVWLLDLTNDTAKQVHDHFKGYVDSNDRLWVSELVSNYWCSNAISGTNDWLAAHPPRR